jgi:HD-GYP domain-containing protein (c-di-GMP phosphodiesterase class II)
MEMLSTADPVTFGVAALASSLAEEVGRRLGLEATWSLRIATMLAPIGLMTLPPAVLRRYRDGESLTEQERQIFDHLPEIGERLLLPIPRLEQVASIIRHQGQDCSGQDAGIPLEARILKAVTDFTALRCRALTATRALELMVGEPGRYDPEVIQALRDMHRDDTQGGTAQAEVREVWIGDLRVGQVLASAMATMEGAVVLPKGTPLSYCHLEKAQNHARLFGLREPIKVFEIQ